eukprot:TRINITY_DN970_c0_g1_i1.p1 TRINITY_DN970_c0_g1~~TRINITY_DN970_c0_g1_i1.p1  ORF type:complete len:887 (+),score=139.08 TRINITY_DN970_c0_g1_i1:40-2661(+)
MSTSTHGDHENGEGKEKFPLRYARAMHSYRYWIVLFWFVVSSACAYFSMSFIGKTSQTFNALPGTDSLTSQNMMTKYFPSLGVSTNIVVYFKSIDGVNVTEQEVLSDFDTLLYTKLNERYNNSGFLSLYESYWLLVKENQTATALSEFVSPDRQATFIVVTVNSMSTTKASTDAAKYVQDIVDEYKGRFAGHDEATCLGLPSFIDTIVSSTETNMGTVDAVSIPLAMLVLMWILKSWRLVILPLTNMGLTAACAFGVMSGVASIMAVNSVAPSLMMSILVAMSIDYNLFLLTRYRDELKAIPDVIAAHLDTEQRIKLISVVIATAGETITVSAVTLGVCFLGLLIVPMDFIQSIGVANAITIFLTLLINITVTPCALFIFSGFFEKCVKRDDDMDDDDDDDIEDECDKSDAANGVQNGESLASSTRTANKKKTFWWKLATVTLTFPYNIVLCVVIIAATIPFDIFAFNNKHTDAMDLFLPRGADVTNAYTDMGNRFGLGKIYPINALLVLRENALKPTTENLAFYNAAGKFAVAVTEDVPFLSKASIQGPVYANNRTISWEEYEVCEEAVKFPQCETNFTDICEECKSLLALKDAFTSKDKRALYMIISPTVDPLGWQGGDIYEALKAVGRAHADAMNADVYYTGYNAITWDTMWTIFDEFTLMILLECAVVFVILTFVFKSLLIPLRAVCTIFLTVAWTFGICDLVYEHNILGWTGIHAFQGVGAVEWTNTVVLFSMIVGIGLDYDIFLLTRIKEYYEEIVNDTTLDLNNNERTLLAIHKGLCDTGHIITAAGMIMGVAFSGLFFSNIPVINQMGFYLVFSVLFDTFVVRSILVPALMSLLGEWNWWPAPLFKKCSATQGYRQIATLNDDHV